MNVQLEQKIERIPCTECQQPFDSTVIILCGEPFSVKCCPSCLNLRSQVAASEAQDAAKTSLSGAWERACPQIYRDTDPERLPAEAMRLMSDWQPAGGRGIGLTGKTGVGKTRCLFLALHRAHAAGMSVEAVSHNRFSRLAQDAFMGEKMDDARTKLRDFHRCAVLLLDDLGKAPRTERADAEIEELIEHRTSAGLPILWTANAGGTWLIERFGKDRGPALVRRLAEFCTCLAL